MYEECCNSQSRLELRPGWMPSQHTSAEGASHNATIVIVTQLALLIRKWQQQVPPKLW
jgi:hypothetical protein